ncbi:MAG TPA: DNA damage-inducible protein D [Pelotomaculum sp.]|nr:DNA damage-inducible protein D [Pelotomaculum sp.]
MDKPVAPSHVSLFEQAKRVNKNGMEFWTARDMQKILEYTDFRNLELAIARAKKACVNSGQNVADHFVDINEMVDIGSGAKRLIKDYLLSRYACYLLIQNADPTKPMVALGQTYFAIQTHKQELFEQSSDEEKRVILREELRKHHSVLFSTAKRAGVETGRDFAIFQNHGYMGLYGGLTQKDLQFRRGLRPTQNISDHMGSTELAANLFRATQTEEKLRRENIRGKQKANDTHYEVGAKVRKAIKDIGGTMPERLPVEEDIKKIERRIKRVKGETKRELKE